MGHSSCEKGATFSAIVYWRIYQRERDGGGLPANLQAVASGECTWPKLQALAPYVCLYYSWTFTLIKIDWDTRSTTPSHHKTTPTPPATILHSESQDVAEGSGQAIINRESSILLKAFHMDASPCWLQRFPQLCQICWLSFGLRTILDSPRKLLSTKNQAALQFWTQASE